MLTSTFLTLFVIPVVYTLLDDLAAWFRGKKPVETPTGGMLTEIPAK